MLIECVPNISEGRRPAVIAAVAAAVRAVPGVALLDIHTDADHNRSVLTFAGPPQPVLDAAFALVATAAELIDLNAHSGQHPRIGATDVLPFVPLTGATLLDCAGFARTVAARIGTELAIPVYCYGAAALRPERTELPNVRRGEYEGLRATLGVDPDGTPDFGPAQLGPAGATAVGARVPLIAYNLFLNTADLAVAKAVAKAVRASSGGLAAVRALGLLVNGQAQVSMNITDHRVTPLHRAVEMVEREAARYGALISHGELVGLLPADALFAVANAALRLHDARPEQVLERQIERALGVAALG